MIHTPTTAFFSSSEIPSHISFSSRFNQDPQGFFWGNSNLRTSTNPQHHNHARPPFYRQSLLRRSSHKIPQVIRPAKSIPGMTPLSEPSAECRSHPIVAMVSQQTWEKMIISTRCLGTPRDLPPPIRAAPVSDNHHQSKRRNVRSPPPRHNGEHMQRLMAHDFETDLPCFEDWNSHLSLVAEAANRDDGGWLVWTKYWWGWCSAH